MTGAAGHDAAAYCATLLREADFDRYASAVFMTGDARRALIALYAFNSEIAGIAAQISNPMAGEIRLQWWRDFLQGDEHGGAAGHPVAAELMRAIECHRLDRQALTRLVDAHRFDLYDEPFADDTELFGYGDNTDGVLFAEAVRIVGARAIPAALIENAGRATALTRLVAAFARSAARGRVIFPGLTAVSLRGDAANSDLRATLREYLDRARAFEAAARADLMQEPAEVRNVFRLLALMRADARSLSKTRSQPRPPRSRLTTLWILWRNR